jgi:hypothetical protein
VTRIDDLPLTPPRQHRGGHRLRDTYRSCQGGRRGIQLATAYVIGRINGTVRVNDDGTRWLIVNAPSHQSPVRRNLANILAVVVLAAAVIVTALTIRRDRPGRRLADRRPAPFARSRPTVPC